DYDNLNIVKQPKLKFQPITHSQSYTPKYPKVTSLVQASSPYFQASPLPPDDPQTQSWGTKGKKAQQRRDRAQQNEDGNGEDGEIQEPLGDNLLGLGAIPNDAAVQQWVGSSATMIAARQERFSTSRDDQDEFFPAPEWGSPGPATARGGGGGGWDLASSVVGSNHSNSSSAVSTPMKRADGGSSIRSGNGPSKMRGANMLSTVPEAPTASASPRSMSDRASLASGNAHAGFATFAALGNSVIINSPPPPPGTRRSRTSVEVKASSPAPSFGPPTSMAFSNTGPVAMPALMMTTGPPLQPATTGGSGIHYTGTPTPRDATSPRPGSERTASPMYHSPGHGAVVVQSPSPISPSQEMGEGKTVATMMQVSYSGGGPSTSVVGLMGSQSNGLQVVIPPPPGSSSNHGNGSRVVSVASSSQQRPISMKDARRVVSSPSIHSQHFAESSGQSHAP
ncbi:hypothetical protein FRB90_010299, partial [Tulasnella sp. 427]